MGWLNRLVIRNGTIGLGIVLKRVRYAEKVASQFEQTGYPGLATEWFDRRDDLKRKFLEMHADLEQRLDRESVPSKGS